MRLILPLLLVGSVSSFAQNAIPPASSGAAANPAFSSSSTVPTGACTSGYEQAYLGAGYPLYVCFAGAWVGAVPLATTTSNINSFTVTYLNGSQTFAPTPTSTLSGAAPSINLASGNRQTITLSAPTVPTVANIAAGANLIMQVCQPATGGPYTWAWPTAIHGGIVIGTSAGTCTVQEFTSFNGSDLVATNAGVTGVAP